MCGGLLCLLCKGRVWRISCWLLPILIPVCYLPLAPIIEMAHLHYSGHSWKLVIALDIRTTFSGAAYTLLNPGKVPQIQSIMRQVYPSIPYPVANGDELSRHLNTPDLGTAKVSSILCYDDAGNFCGIKNGIGLQDDDLFLTMKWWETVSFARAKH